MTSKQWQLAEDAAKRYEEILVQAILGPFAQALVDWVDFDDVTTVVDVGCGTGAATRFAAAKLENTAKVIGTDINTAMLKVAESLPTTGGAEIEWREANAYKLPFDDASVDVVLCAQSLQFMPERDKALSEMHRILKAGGSAYISLWCEIEDSPYFDALVATIAKHISADTAAGLGSAFKLTDLDEITASVQAGGFQVESTKAGLNLNLPPIAEFVPKHIRATPMGAGYNAAFPETQQAILDDMTERLAEYVNDDGMEVPFCSHLIRGGK